MELLGYIAAIFMGLSLGLIGGGGSILTVPILVYLFGQDPLVATTGSLFVVGSNALFGGLTYARQGLVDFKTGLIFAIPSFAGVYFARNVLLPSIPDTIFSTPGFVLTKPLLVLAGFAILMVAASISMIRTQNKVSPDRKKSGPFRVSSRGFLVGGVTGFVGAGGGFLIIPALVLLLELPMRVAVGTSLAIIAMNSLFGFAISAGSQPLNWDVLLTITALGILGLFAGHHLSPRVEERTLKKGFGLFVLILGLSILISQLKD